MRLVYTPPDGPAQEWEFDPSRLMVAELDAIEKVTGLSGLNSLGEALNNYSGSAVRALVWVLRKRQDPALRFEAVDFAIGDIAFVEDEAPPKDDGEGPPSSQASASDAGG